MGAAVSAPAGVQRGWWRRNVAGLCVATLCLPSFLGVTAWVSMTQSDFAATTFGTVSAAQDARVEVGELSVGPLQVEKVSQESAEAFGAAVPGTNAYFVAAKLAPQGGASSPECSAALREADGAARVFTPVNDYASLNESDDYRVGCARGEQGEYHAVFLFVLPDGVSANAVLDVRFPTSDPRRYDVASFSLTLPRGT